ncbi:calcium-dependent protein kinase 4-like [Adelges cooleyi]|uniref:calcium-dependent protein kinase 4-like n=1 Tax=Adelges cooleyi TaxID=133065 RepID=UPI0021803A6E|nr:calcium-dependent protein kinase 4-like [Adelges cooleyi]
MCVLRFIEVNSTLNSIETNSKADDVNGEWQEKFSKYDTDKNGLISATELQKLLFNESIGFVTIKQATNYIPLLDRGGKGQIRFDHLKKIEPIMAILSQRKTLSLVDDKKTISSTDFQKLLYENFKQTIFESLEEVEEIIDLINKDENGQIKYNKFMEIENMLKATLQLDNLFEVFSIFDTDKLGVVTVDAVQALMEIANSESDDFEKATEAIKKFDKNGDGVIEFSEFLQNIDNLNEDEFSIFEEFTKKLSVTLF